MEAFYECRNQPLQVTPIDNLSFPLHLHTDVEIIYVSDGRVKVHIDGRQYALKAGEVAVVFPNVVHGYMNDGECDGKGFFFIFPPEISADYGRVLFKYRPCEPVLNLKRLNPDVDMVIKCILAERKGGNDAAVLRAYMQVLLARAVPELELSEKKDNSMRSTMYQILAYLSEHCTEAISLEDIARHFDLSVSYISHRFSDTIKVNFRAYVNALRLLHATVMLKNTEMPVTRICFDCGFESQRTFNRAFHEQYGKTPTEYRREALMQLREKSDT